MTFTRSLLATLVVFSLVATAGAVDTVYLKNQDKRVAGEISDVTKESITVTPKIGSPTTVPAGDVDRIEWDGEPPTLGLARSEQVSGHYERALENFEKALNESPADKDNLRDDIEFGIASTIGRIALADPEKQSEAIAKLTTFAQSHPDSYRYFDALLLLGDLQLAAGDGNAAEGTFHLVAGSKRPNYQMAAKVNIGRVQLARGDFAAAQGTFDEVADMPAASPVEQSRKFQAMLGQASCLQQQGQNAEAATILGEIIKNCAPTDTRLEAEAYLRQGDAYAAQGQQAKEAVRAYLHVDVIPSLAREKDLHAEALYRLSQLWPVVGEPARAEVAAGKLQADYPHSEWAKKLAGG